MRGLPFCVLLGLVTPAGAAPAVLLHDGPHVRRVERLGTSADGLSAVRLTDVHTGLFRSAWVGRRAIVQLDDPAALNGYGARPIRAILPARNLWLVESSRADEDGLALAARLQANPAFGSGMKQAIPDLYLPRVHKSMPVPPDDPRYPGQWFYQRIGLEDAWRIETGKAEVSIVVIDNGCDTNHPDLRDKMDPGLDLIDGDDDPRPDPNVTGNAHGTGCAGLVAASTNNGVGIAGVCPGCRLRCVRLLDDTGHGLVAVSSDVDAFQFVLDSGAAVASNSWGFKDPGPVPQPLADAITLVHEQGRAGKGALVVFAAGNDDRRLGADELEAVPGVVTVGAVNNFDEVAQFSNFGAPIDVVAPLGTLTTDISGPDGEDPGDYWASFGGTSSACPIVAGIFGLLASAAPDRSAADLEEALRSSAMQSPYAMPDASGHDDYYGWGLVQPAAALKMVKPPEPPPGGCDHAGDAPAPSMFAMLLLLIAVGLIRRRAR